MAINLNLKRRGKLDLENLPNANGMGAARVGRGVTTNHNTRP